METGSSHGILSRFNFSVDLKGQVAIVTGAARGIGRAVADALAASGVSVLGIDQISSQEAGEVAEIPHWLEKTVDISQPGEVAQAVDFCIEELGVPDVLVHVAGISKPCRVSDMSLEDWHRMIDVNLQPAYYLSRAVLPHMVERGKGCIIFFSSMIASTGGETSAHYTAAKSGVEGFSRSMAREVGPRGIRVNVIAPGMIDTVMLDLMPDSQKEKLVHRIPLKRIGFPSDLVGPVFFLISDAGAYVTGQTIHVNGGMYMK